MFVVKELTSRGIQSEASVFHRQPKSPVQTNRTVLKFLIQRWRSRNILNWLSNQNRHIIATASRGKSITSLASVRKMEL